MKKLTLAVLISIPFLSLSAYADDSTINTSTPSEKNWNVGIGSYASTIGVDGSYRDEDIEFSGLNFTGSYNFSDNFAIRASYFSLENDDFSALESKGLDLVAYYGTGLATNGFKAYVGGGLYSDTWSAQGEEEDFSGFQINGGIGYNWSPVALDLVLGIRSAGDYADLIEDGGGSGEVVAVSASLLVSARF